MTLPPMFHFLRPGWWALHLVALPAVFAGGIALGIFHATGHGGPDAHAGHAAPASPDAHAGHAGHAAGPAPAPVTGNPLRDEMLDLQIAFDKLNQGVVLGRTDGIVEAFHAVHARREATVAGIVAGTVRPPKNADRMDAFVARDDAFHAIIEGVVEASAKGDLPALQAKSTEMRDACVSCHTEFRQGSTEP